MTLSNFVLDMVTNNMRKEKRVKNIELERIIDEFNREINEDNIKNKIDNICNLCEFFKENPTIENEYFVEKARYEYEILVLKEKAYRKIIANPECLKEVKSQLHIDILEIENIILQLKNLVFGKQQVINQLSK